METDKDILDEFKESIVLLQGIFQPADLDRLKDRKEREVFVMEGRPSLEAAQFTCSELLKRKIKPTLIADNMAGFLFYKDLVKEVWLSYQTQDKEGALCPIGGLILGVLGKRHKVPVHLYPSGRALNLIGNQKEIFYFKGVKIAPNRIKGYVPLAEWVPQKYISEITE